MNNFKKMLLRNFKFRLIDIVIYSVIVGILYYRYLVIERYNLDWPAMDMAPYLRRKMDPTFLLNDVYTNFAFVSSPRNLFGSLLFLIGNAFKFDWYEVFAFSKLILTVLAPIAVFNFFYFILKSSLKMKDKGFGNIKSMHITFLWILTLFIFLFIKEIRNCFSVAWWAPLELQPIPQTISLLMIFFGANCNRYVRTIFWIIAVLIQPVVGGYVIITLNIISFVSVKRFLLNNLCIIVGYFFIWYFFSSERFIETKKFIEIYVFNTTIAHYSFFYFGSFDKYPWYVHYIINQMCFFLAIALDLKLNKTYSKRFVLLMLFYVLSPFMQLLFLDVFQLRIAAIFTPIRFSSLGFWIFLAYVLHILFNFSIKIKIGQEHEVVVSRNLFQMFYSISIIFLLTGTLPNYQELKTNIVSSNKAFWEFIRKTPEGSVFILPNGKLNLEIPLVGERASYSMMNIPFNEEYFELYFKRKKNIIGSFDEFKNSSGETIVDKVFDYYLSHDSQYYCNISREDKVNYVIMETGHIKKFKKCNIFYGDKEYTIFSIADMCRCH